MHLGRTKAGAAAHFPQATSEGNTPPGPPSLAELLLQAQGRASQQLGCADNAMKTSGDLQILIPTTSKQTGGRRLYTAKTNTPDETLPTTLRVSCHGRMVLTSGSITQPKIRHLPLPASIFAFQFVLQEA
ncbi:unnamed protein product [Bubo scandiacus]